MSAFRKSAWCVLVLVIGMFAGADPIGAQDGRNIRVGYSQFPPFSSTSQTGVAEGYSIDIIRMLLEPLGYSLTFVPFNNPAEMLASLDNKEISLTTVLADNAERRQYGVFTDVVASVDVRIFVRDGQDVPINVEDLKGLRVGATVGSVSFRLLSEVEGAVPVPYQNSAALIVPLLSGEVDAVASSLENLSHLANLSELSHRITATSISLRRTPVSLLVDRNEAGLLLDLNESIESARRTGDFDDLYQNWFAARAAPITSREQIVVSVALAIAFSALLYWARLHYIVLRRAQRMEARSKLLAETLDATGSSLAIFDEDMNPIYWNEGFRHNFPKQVPLLEQETDMEALILAAYQNGSLGVELSIDEAKAKAKKSIEILNSGGELESLNTTVNGQVLRRLTLRLPNRHFATIASDVTQLVETQQGLERARAELEGANQKLVEFNRIAAHDLVAPLRNVRNIHNWIKDDIEEAGVGLDDETKENFKLIDVLLKRQGKMIQDLLEFSHTGVSKTAEDFDPVERFEAVAELANAPKGFKVVFPSAVPHIHASPVAFDIVLRNIISNAVKHHDRPHGQVEIQAEIEGKMCVFSVLDDGPGIPEAALEKVFEPFTRLKSRDEGAGSGLGLAFIRRRVEEWGGTASAKSHDGERGTTITFTVPLATSQVALPNSLAS